MQLTSIQEKKTYLNWVLNTHPFENSIRDLLIFLQSRDQILSRLEFVDHSEHKNTFFIQSLSFGKKNNFHYKEGEDKIENLYLHLLTRPRETFYLILFYKDKFKERNYNNLNITEEEINQIIQTSLYTFEILKIKEKIDHALDCYDRKEFLKWSVRLLELLQKNAPR